ncbi:arginase [Amylibacter sp.]|nr:arginase [Amylibacter sp.]
MANKKYSLIGVPLDCGKIANGCLMGPDAYRTAGIVEMISALGHEVEDFGNICPEKSFKNKKNFSKIHKLDENIAWIKRISAIAQDKVLNSIPVFMGGDHALSSGSVSGISAFAKRANRPLFVLWLDAHPDFHTLKSSLSGNLHGTPVAYFTGQLGFEKFPHLEAPIPYENILMLGLRSVDSFEKHILQELSISTIDMRYIDEFGIKDPLEKFLAHVKDVNGMLHVSLDVDFLDPIIAPAVGTTVPGGATIREAHLVMEMLHDSDLMTSIDLVELNPFLDNKGQTALVMVDLLASALGRRIFDKSNSSYV